MKLLRVLGLLVCGALVYQGAQVIMQSQALQISKYEIQGNTHSRVSNEELIHASRVELGDHLLGVSTKGVADRLEQLPWIAKARVERILPSTLRVSVEERRPLMVVVTEQGSYLVDPAGLVLQEGSEPLVLLVEAPVGTLESGKQISTAEFDHAARILASLPSDIRVRVSAIRASSIDQIQLETRGGPVIYYGAAEQIEEKNFAVQALLGGLDSGASHVGVVDVRVPSRPSTRR